MAENGPVPSSTKRRAAGSDVITLAQPRPGRARRINEYIEAPFKAKSASSSFPSKDVVSVQPRKKLLPEKPSDAESTSSSEGELQRPDRTRLDTAEESIICRQCGRCRCDACRTPKPLPSRWVCHDKIQCSGPAAVDLCSCVCCVKGLFYHWGQNYGDPEDEDWVSCADQPCSCAPRRRFLRWGCLGLLSLALPCLCCYLPLRGCLRLAEGAHGRLTSHGCRCRPPPPDVKPPASPDRTEKRPLTHPEC